MRADRLGFESVSKISSYEIDVREGDYSDLRFESVNQSLRDLTDIDQQLEHSIWNEDDQAFIKDFHNKALTPWIAAYNEWNIQDVTLIHLDLHKDH